MTMTDHPSYCNPGYITSDEGEVSGAIDRSISHNEIVHMRYTETVIRLLKEECEDWTKGNDWFEFWGKNIDGNEWRVHVRKP